MVASGKYQGKNYDVVEIINLIDPKMKYEFIDERTARSRATGFLLQDQPIICGGMKFKDYIILGQPDQTFETLEERECSTGLVLNKNLAWIVGGRTLLDNQPTEFISLDQTPVQGPTLPPLDYLSSQAMVRVDKETIYMIYHHDTWIIDPTNDFKMEKGPPLNWPQYENLLERKLLATMKIQGDTFLVALAYQWGNSVKLLNTSCHDQGWIDGNLYLILMPTNLDFEFDKLCIHFKNIFTLNTSSFNFYISTLKPRYNEPQYSEFRNIVNKTQLLFGGFTKYITFVIVNYSI